MRLLKLSLAVLLWSVIALCLAATILPYVLDRIYYRGPVSNHFDGARFFNPDGDDDRLSAIGRVPFGTIARHLIGDSERPTWPEHVAVEKARPPAHVADGMLATWVGHATLLVQADGINILTDPVWSKRAGPFGIGPDRVAEPGIAFDDLPRIDLILVSHDHYDHMDLSTLARLWKRDHPLIVTSLGNESVMAAAGVPAQALDWGERLSVRPGVSVVVTRSHHWDSRWFADRNRALWSSFVVVLPRGNFFFAGDTGAGDMRWPAEAAALGPIRLAAIPIGAFRFAPGEMGSGAHIGPYDAIRVWNGLGRPRSIPIHWGTFHLSFEGYRTPPALLAAMLDCAGAGTSQFAAVPIGQVTPIAPLSTAPAAPSMAGIAQCARQGRFKDLR